MMTYFGGEWFWTRRRRALRSAVLVAVAITVATVVSRWLSTSSDLAPAFADAQRHIDQAAANGVKFEMAEVFNDPRYALATQMPIDTAALALAIALIGLVAGALAVGGEWRTGTIRLSFVTPSARTQPTLARLTVWWLVWTSVGALCLIFAIGGLSLVGSSRGLSDGVTASLYVGLVVRGTLAVGAGVLLGAGLATLFRSDAVVMVLMLGYVLIAEILLPALLGVSGYLSPGVRLIEFIISRDLSQPLAIECGQAPRCEEVFATTAGAPGVYLALILTILGVGALAIWRAQRPIWK